MSFFDYLKNIFIVLIFLQLTPPLLKSIRKQYGRFIIKRAKVAVINIKGVVYNSDHYNKYLNKYFKDKEIKAILLKIECPGSAAGTAQAIFNEINVLKKKYPSKPIVSLVENICTSGGYYIACATNSVIAPASSLIGSIGSNLPYLFQLQEFIEQYKIKYTTISAGKYKSAGDPFVQLTPDNKAMLQNVIDDAYDQFMLDVIKTRKLSLNNKQEWAEGKIFTGRQAHKLGLIDKIGSSHDAIEILKEAALIKEKIEWVHPAKKGGFLSLFGGKDGGDKSESMFASFANALYSTFEKRYLTTRLF